jgi:hypothetical protein
MLRRIRYSFGKVSAETGTMKDALQGELIVSSSRLRRAARRPANWVNDVPVHLTAEM